MMWSNPLLGTILSYFFYKPALLLESSNPALERCPLAAKNSLKKKENGVWLGCLTEWINRVYRSNAMKDDWTGLNDLWSIFQSEIFLLAAAWKAKRFFQSGMFYCRLDWGGVRVKANKSGGRNKDRLFWLEVEGVIISMKVVVVECE